MKKDYTILMPQMAPIHFEFIETALKHSGYNVVLLPSVDSHAVEEGLRYINNDACYPTIVALGQVIAALKSGEYDVDKTAIFMSQTGGGCRASNYVGLLRKALKDLEMEQVPVVSVNLSGLESNPGFSITPPMVKRVLMAGVYGDVLMRVLHATRPYEKTPGSANELYRYWAEKVKQNIEKGGLRLYKEYLKEIVKDFDELPIHEGMKKPKVGVVGEILVKYHPTANNDIVGIIEQEGGEAVVLDLIDFFLYGMYSKTFNYEKMSGTYKQMFANNIAIKVIEKFRAPAREALRNSKRFTEPHYIEDIAKTATKSCL